MAIGCSHSPRAAICPMPVLHIAMPMSVTTMSTVRSEKNCVIIWLSPLHAEFLISPLLLNHPITESPEALGAWVIIGWASGQERSPALRYNKSPLWTPVTQGAFLLVKWIV